jgi:DNA repair protein RecN (Recombination protein N)
MLTRLTIDNLAIIEHVCLTLGPGLTVLTGETGSGKSLILDGLALLFGAKLSTKALLRTPTNTVKLEAEWHLPISVITQLPLSHVFHASDAMNPQAPLVCRREITARQSRFWINNQPVERELMAQVGQLVLDQHNQHDLSAMFLPGYQLQCLDNLGDAVHQQTLANMAKAYDHYLLTKKQLHDFSTQWQQQQQAIGLWQGQLAELQKAQLTDAQEDVQLKDRLDTLNQQQLLAESLQEAGQRCQSRDPVEFPGIVEQVDHLIRLLKPFERLSHLDEHLTPLKSHAQELQLQLAQAQASIGFSPAELDQLSTRYTQLERLKRKTGKTLDALLAWQHQLETKLANLVDPEGTLAQLQQAVDTAMAQCQALANTLTQSRQTMAEQLEVALNHTLVQLAMPNARLSIQLASQGMGRLGQDQVNFLFSANQGQPLRPLAKVASGGELSRVLFAIKCHVVQPNETRLGSSLLVLDEIDTGLSGEAVAVLAQAMHRLAQHVQVLAVTHQPIVAAAGDGHWHILKHQANETTWVEATALVSRADRLQVLSQLASGSQGKAVGQFVDQLLDQAADWKHRLAV